LHQKYKIKEVIGRGHFSIVKRCVDKKTGENLALKCINKSKLKEKDHRWLQSEIEILTAVSHTNICRLVQVFQTQKMCYLVLELLQGGDLLERVADDHNFSDDDAADVIRTVAGVLQYLHSMGIIHRDLKPQNLVYRSDAKGAQLVVTDFGLSKFLKGGMTHTKTACGTPLYLAPEVIMGNGYGKECDMWSLGVMLYVLLTGYYPFYSSDRRRLYSKITRCSYKWPSNGGESVDARAKDLVASLLVVDHRKRLTADEVLQHPWLTLPRTKTKESKARENIRKMRAKMRLRKTVNYLIDINRFLSVFALLPEEIQQRCGGRIYRKSDNDRIRRRMSTALGQMATALVDPEMTHYSLVYRMKSGGYWLVSDSDSKQDLEHHAKKYFSKDDKYYIFAGPTPRRIRFLDDNDLNALADNSKTINQSSPVNAPHPPSQPGSRRASHIRTIRPSLLKMHSNINKSNSNKSNNHAADDNAENINGNKNQDDIDAKSQLESRGSVHHDKRLSELEANAIVKVTTKLIASKLFSPPMKGGGGRAVRFDFSKALQDDNDDNDQRNKNKNSKLNDISNDATENANTEARHDNKNDDDDDCKQPPKSPMSLKVITALEEQVSKAQERYQLFEQKAKSKGISKKDRKTYTRELTIAKEALQIAKSLHKEALERQKC